MRFGLLICNVVLLLAATSLGGCFGEKEPSKAGEPTPTGSSSTGSSTPTNGPGPDAIFPTLNHTLHLNDCKGVSVNTDVPEPVWPNALPPGWEENGIVTISIEILECQRISVGPFERGPMFVMREVHLFPQTQSNCAAGDYDNLSILEAFWVSDPEVATHLSQTYGMPAAFAEFRVESVPIGPLTNTTWTFGLPGMAPSWMRVVNSTDLPEAVSRVYERMVWLNQYGGITYLHHEQTYSDDLKPTGVNGKIRPPLPYNTLGVEDFSDGGGPMWDDDSSGTFSQFRDLACDEPV